MRAHRLAEWLLDRPDGEVYLAKVPDDKLLRDLNITRPLRVDGILGDKGDGKVVLMFEGERTEEEDKAYHEKYAHMIKNHPDRLLTADMEFASAKEKALAALKEAKSKGYVIIPADNQDRDEAGYVVYKEVDGVELAYNPRWSLSEGLIDIDRDVCPKIAGEG